MAGRVRIARERRQYQSYTLSFLSHALHEPPVVTFEVDGLVGAVRPVVFPVVLRLRLAHDRRPARSRSLAVCVNVVDEDAERLGVGAADRSRGGAGGAVFATRFRVSGPHHDEALSKRELGVHDDAAFPLYFQPYL